jgi:hypothetical protein
MDVYSTKDSAYSLRLIDAHFDSYSVANGGHNYPDVEGLSLALASGSLSSKIARKRPLSY